MALNLKNIVGQIIRRRAIGFYLTAAASILSFISAFLYKSVVVDARYFSSLSFTLSLLPIAAFVLLSLFKVTEDYAAGAVTIIIFLAFLQFIRPQDGYIGDLYYGATLVEGYIFVVLSYFVCMALGIAGIFMKQSKVMDNIENNLQLKEY